MRKSALKTSSNPKPSGTKSKLPLLTTLVIGAIVIIGLVLGAMWLYNKSTVNYAEDVARPLEQSLIKTGAIKKCIQADTGRGSDNLNPWYNVVFETDLSKEKAFERVTNLAKEEGYSIAYTRSPNEYIDNYSDETTKNSPYSDLQSGEIQLGVNFYSGGNNLGCSGGVAVKYDANHTAIVLNVSLPEFKR